MKTVTIDSNIKDIFFDTNAAEMHKTITSGLSKQERLRYSHTVRKAAHGRVFNLKDLKILDKVDELIMQKHSLCLKDDLVTKARINACKKYNMQFIDRDGLEDHMHKFFRGANESKENIEMDAKLVYLLVEKLGENFVHEFANTVFKIIKKTKLTFDDVRLPEQVERVLNRELDATMLTDDLRLQINAAAEEFGVGLTNSTLQ